MNEPAIDLGIVLALISSHKDKPIDEKTICFGEVGLSGEVRAVNMAEHIFSPHFGQRSNVYTELMEIIPSRNCLFIRCLQSK